MSTVFEVVRERRERAETRYQDGRVTQDFRANEDFLALSLTLAAETSSPSREKRFQNLIKTFTFRHKMSLTFAFCLQQFDCLENKFILLEDNIYRGV